MNRFIKTLLLAFMLVYCNPAYAEDSFEQKYGNRLVSFLQEDSEVPYHFKITLAQYIEFFTLKVAKRATVVRDIDAPTGKRMVLHQSIYEAVTVRDIDAHTVVLKVDMYNPQSGISFTVETVFVAQDGAQHVLATKLFENGQELHGQARENEIMPILMIAEKEMLK